MFSLRTHAWIFFGLLAAIVLLGIGGNLLADAGFQPAGTWLQLPVQVLFLGLVLALALAFVPFMVKLVIGAQLKVGNGDKAMVRSLAKTQNAIIWVLWILMLGGLAVALPTMIEDGFFAGAATPAAAADPGPSEGMLVAAPGMPVAEMLAQSTLKLAGGGKPNVPFAGGAVFDFRVAGTGTVFHHCRYYFVSTLTKDPQRIEALSVGTSPRKYTRAELDAADAALQTQLKDEGWRAGHEEYKTAENQQLHGGATRGPEGWVWLKNGIVLSILVKRMDEPVSGEDPATAGQWIQFIDLWPEATYPGREFLVFQPAQ